MADFNKPLDIVVIGGSLAALFTSIPLLRLPVKHKVTILERSPVPLLHDQGAGIVAGAETLSWFERHDVSVRRGDADKMSVLSHERLYLDKEGNVINREESRQRMTSWDLAYFLGRWGFDAVPSGYVGGQGEVDNRENNTGGHIMTQGENDGRAVYDYGCAVEKIEEVGEKVRVTYMKTRQEGDIKEGTIDADFLIVADGPSSSIRKILLGEAAAGKRTYAGYVAFRGTVPEFELSEEARKVFVQRFTFFHGHQPNTQTLAYTIPGAQGTVTEGKRLVNWVWYWNLEEDSKDYGELMTDSDGKRHRFTLPTGGKMQKHVWDSQLKIAARCLPPQFSEIITKTKNPFVQAITDLEPPASDTRIGHFLNGRAVIVGDALAGFRPHTAASTSQAALHGLLLEKVFLNEMSWDQYEKLVMDFASRWQQRGVMLGQRSQFGLHPLATQQGQTRNDIQRDELWMKK